MSDNDYNGWANYETWNIVLWINNDEGMYNHALSLIEQLLAIHDNDWQNVSIAEIRELVREAIGRGSTPDGVSLSHREVDWYEISDALLDIAQGNNLQTSAEAN